MASLDDLRLFTLTVRYQGISAAAKQCNMQRSKVSRRLQALERQLGYQLLIRTTRTIELTEQGKWLYQQVSSHISALEESMTLLEEQNRGPTGRLRMAIPPVLGVTEFFTDVLGRYNKLYPEVHVEIEHQKQAIDLRRSNVDLQILPVYQPPLNDDYVQQHFLGLPCSMIASYDYLERMGEPKNLDDLDHHVMLGNRYSSMQLPDHLDYCVFSEDLHLLRNLARDGKGITMLPTVMLDSGLADGTFKSLMTDRKFADLKVTLIYASQPYLPEKCRVMVQLLRDTLTEENVINYPA